jgi:hypothetical protein
LQVSLIVVRFSHSRSFQFTYSINNHIRSNLHNLNSVTMTSKFILVSLISLAAAQNAPLSDSTTVSVPWIGLESDSPSVFTDIYASVVTANPTATTLALACATASINCGLFPAETLVFGPSTYNLDMGDPSPESDFTATMDCVVAKSAVCKESASGTEANFPGSSTETYDAESVGTFGLIITAGADKLNFKAEATTTEAAASSATMETGSSMSGSKEQNSASTGVAVGSGSVSQTGSAAVVEATGAANAKAVVGGGLLSVAAGVIGGLLL